MKKIMFKSILAFLIVALLVPDLGAAASNSQKQRLTTTRELLEPPSVEVVQPIDSSVTPIDSSTVVGATYASPESGLPIPISVDLNNEDTDRKYTVVQSTYGSQKKGLSSKSMTAAASSSQPMDANLLKTISNSITSKNLQAPITIGSEQESVSSMDGSLSLNNTDLTLPGRNGLSFSLNRYYNSNSAFAFDKETEYDLHCDCAVRINYKLAAQFSDDQQNISGTVYYPVDGLYKLFDQSVVTDGSLSTFTGAQGWVQYLVNEYRGKVIDTPGQWEVNDGSWIPGPKYIRIVNYVPDDANVQLLNYSFNGQYTGMWDNIAKNKPYEQQMYPIGTGWSWDIPYIKQVESSRFLIMGSSGSYKINGNKLEGYLWKDLTIENDSSVNVNNEGSSQVLRSTKGRKYYFAADGRLIQISDNYDNTIKFTYAQDPKYGKVLSSITDAVGNTIQITYSAQEIVLTMGSKVVRYAKSHLTKNGLQPYRAPHEVEYLTDVTDTVGRTTHFDYTERNTSFNFTMTVPKNNPLLLLNNVRYHNGSQTQYVYENSPTTRNVGTAQTDKYIVFSRVMMSGMPVSITKWISRINRTLEAATLRISRVSDRQSPTGLKLQYSITRRTILTRRHPRLTI